MFFSQHTNNSLFGVLLFITTLTVCYTWNNMYFDNTQSVILTNTTVYGILQSEPPELPKTIHLAASQRPDDGFTNKTEH